MHRSDAGEAARHRNPSAFLLLAASLSLFATACRPVPAVPSPATLPAAAAVPAIDTRVPVNTPVAPAAELPDDAGYFARPVRTLRWDSDFTPLEDGPAGPLLSTLQRDLSAGDADAVVGRLGAAPSLTLHLLDGDAAARDVAGPDVAVLLRRLFAAGSRPVVQGYFATTADGRAPNEPLLLAAAASDTVRIDVVIAGWTGPAGALEPTAPTEAAPHVSVWRFDRAGDRLERGGNGGSRTGNAPVGGADWTWRTWRWLPSNGYVAAVAALEDRLDDPASYRYTRYDVVRPAALWPAVTPTLLRQLPSPDGEFMANEITSEPVVVDPHDPASVRHLVAVEVVDAAGHTIARPIARWLVGDMGESRPSAEGWWPGRGELLVADLGSGDGCVVHRGGPLWRFRPATGELVRAPLPAGAVPQPRGPRLARLGLGRVGDDGAGQPRPVQGVVTVADVDTGTVVSATFTAAEHGDDLTWAPDGASVAFSVVDDYESCFSVRTSHIARFDLATGRVLDVTASAPGWRIVTAWHVDGVITVDAHTPGPDGTVARPALPARTEWLDARTGALLGAATATRTP